MVVLRSFSCNKFPQWMENSIKHSLWNSNGGRTVTSDSLFKSKAMPMALKCSPQTCNINITWELIYAKCEAPLGSTKSETLEMDPVICLIKPPGNSESCWSLRDLPNTHNTHTISFWLLIVFSRKSLKGTISVCPQGSFIHFIKHVLRVCTLPDSM